MVVTKNRNVRNGLFHSVLFWILDPEAIRYPSLNPKNFDLGIPNPKSKFFHKQTENYRAFYSIPFWVLVIALKMMYGSKMQYVDFHAKIF